MADTLNIYGVTYQGVEGIKATDSNNNVLTYVRPQGTKTITENGTGIDVAQYQYADVNVSGGGSGSIVDVTDMPVFTVEFIDDLSDIDSISCNMTYLECYDYVTGQMVDEGYAAVALLMDVNNDVTSYYGCYYHGASAAALYFVVMDNTEPIGDLIFDNSGTITFSALSTALGIAGTPTATKGTVSNHSVAITPSVTNAAGYIAGGTKTGTAVTVEASELVSGTKQITANGQGIDVTNYESVDVNVPNRYTSADEGKVVSSGALVAQTSDTVTVNDTYDTTLINSLTVNVSGGGGWTPEQINLHQVTGSIDLGASTYAGSYAFYGQTSITGVVGSYITGTVENSAFRGCTALETVNMPHATVIDANAFRGCSALETVNLPEVTRVGTANASKTDMYIFYGCSKMTTFYMPSLLTAHGYYTLAGLGSSTNKCMLVLPKLTSTTTSSDNNMFRGGYFSAADFGPDYAYITDASFYGGSISVLILRRTTDVVGVYSSTSINSVNANTKVYVPSALIDSYKAASQWSAKSASIWYAIEGSAYEHYYANGVGVFQPITANLTNCTSDNDAADVSYGEGYSATLTADAGYTLSSVSVTMNSVDITSTAYNPQTGNINIAAVDGAIIITATAS